MEQNNRSPWQHRGEREQISLALVSSLLYQLDSTLTIEESKDIYAHYDLLVNNSLYIEVKERFMTSQNFKKYSAEGLIFEKIKYDFLSTRNGRYINHFNINNNVFLMSWNIRELSLTFNGMNCKATTDFNNNDYVEKAVTLLKPSNAKIYQLIDLKWELITYNNLINKL